MFIDTHTKRSMEESLCGLMSISVEKLYGGIDHFENICGSNYDICNNEIRTFIDEHLPETSPDEILLFHLSCRLKGTEQDVIGRNLLDLLTTENAFSAAMEKFGIEFFKGTQHIETVYCGKIIDWDKCWNGNSSYMKSQFGYFKGRKDFCFNGFAFKDLLYKNDRTPYETRYGLNHFRQWCYKNA